MPESHVLRLFKVIESPGVLFGADIDQPSFFLRTSPQGGPFEIPGSRHLVSRLEADLRRRRRFDFAGLAVSELWVVWARSRPSSSIKMASVFE
jgi:hypothetical protein